MSRDAKKIPRCLHVVVDNHGEDRSRERQTPVSLTNCATLDSSKIFTWFTRTLGNQIEHTKLIIGQLNIISVEIESVLLHGFKYPAIRTAWRMIPFWSPRKTVQKCLHGKETDMMGLCELLLWYPHVPRFSSLQSHSCIFHYELEGDVWDLMSSADFTIKKSCKPFANFFRGRKGWEA